MSIFGPSRRTERTADQLKARVAELEEELAREAVEREKRRERDEVERHVRELLLLRLAALLATAAAEQLESLVDEVAVLEHLL